MCRSGLNKRYLLTSSYSERKYIPPHQSLNATASPQGEAFFTPREHSKYNNIR